MERSESIKITTRDMLLRAWLNSTELVRDYQMYAKEIHDDDEVRTFFKEFAENEAVHAAKLREMLVERQ